MSKTKKMKKNLVEKLNLLLESSKLDKEELGKWLREKGLHSEHLNVWKQELELALLGKRKEEDDELKKADKRIVSLEKELVSKEKALSELTTLLVLKKKVEILMSDEER